MFSKTYLSTLSHNIIITMSKNANRKASIMQGVYIQIMALVSISNKVMEHRPLNEGGLVFKGGLFSSLYFAL